MFVDEAGLVDDVELLALPLLEGQRLIQGQTQLAGDIVDAAREDVGLQRRGILDHPHDDALEVGLLAPPVRILVQHDMRAAHHLGDAVGAGIKAGIGRIGVVERLVLVLRGVGEGRPFQMRGQDVEAGHVVVVERDPVDMQDEGLFVDRVDLEDAAEAFGAADPRHGILADLPGEDHVLGGDGLAVAPARGGVERHAQRDTFLSLRQVFQLGAPVLEGRNLGAHQAGELPILVVGHHRPPRHAQDVGLGHHGVDHGVEGRRELRDADGELLVRRRLRATFARESEGEKGQENTAERSDFPGTACGVAHALEIAEPARIVTG